jgi:hypothetical protein
MVPSGSASTEDMRRNWTVLPPIKLKGVGTALVESVQSYANRMIWTTGIPMGHLAKRVARHAVSGARSGRSFSSAEAFGAAAISRIEQLEVLSGETNLRCGSFWALSEIVSYNSSVYGRYKRRWCPRCYEEWDGDSYEPLIWRIDLLGACPRHQCRMECTCPKCGEFQGETHQQELRRICRACGASLSTGTTWRRRPAFAQWIDEQIMQLIEYCATPREAPAPLSIYTDLAAGLRINAKRSGRRDAVMKVILRNIERHARRNSRRPTLRSLLNVCALQGISAQELLCAPRQVSGPMLFDQWPGMTYLPLPSAVHAQRIYTASRYLRDFIALDPPFFPPINILLRDFHIQSRALRDVSADLVEAYDERYVGQRGMCRQPLLRSAFLCAKRVLDRSGGSPTAESFAMLTRSIVSQTGVTLQDAAKVLESAKLMLDSQADDLVERYRAELPLRSALDWFLERRQFHQ